MLRLALVLLVGVLGCESIGGVWNPPGRDFARAQSAVEQKDFETAYRHLTEIRNRYPESPESREAFRLAALILKKNYFESRFTRPDSRWLTSEPRFMLDWFLSYLDGPEFPEDEAAALFIGMPFGFFREYLALAESRPELSRWEIRAEDDNGMIERITAGGGAL